ncbi:MAG: hypothetical protein LRY50_10035 [Geovibrio sp.]|nr:hypothetical protein [Geovibrio sp.]
MKKLLPLYINRLSPCYSRDHLGNHGCYARNDIPRFLHLTALGRFDEAFYVLKETNPFSSGCGRFCDHPCETACNRTKYDQPVDIKALERFVSDAGYEKGLKPKMTGEAKDKKNSHSRLRPRRALIRIFPCPLRLQGGGFREA